MKYYTGLDVSMKTTSLCIINQDGKIVYETSVPSEPKYIATAIKETKLQIEKVALESGSISRWLAKELENLGLPIICIDARIMSKVLSININKTDKNDARLIAEALRCSFFSEVHLKSDENIELNMLISAHRTLTDVSTKFKNTIRGHLKAFGIRLGTLCSDKFSIQVLKAIEDKPEYIQFAIKILLKSFEEVVEKHKQIETYIEKIAKKDEDTQLLMTIPGVGPITAIAFKSSLGDPKRFSTSRSVGAFFGLTPKQYSSGETTHIGRISKRGPTETRYLLVGAATSLLYRTKSWSKLKAWGLKLKKKKGHKKTVIAVGRKLATIMYRMLLTRRPFEYGDFTEKQIEKLMKLAC